MISIQNLQKMVGTRLLFERVSLQLNPKSRYGLVGSNGSGKTTFLKILAGEEAETDGAIHFPKKAKIGFLQQDQFANDQDVILDCVMRGVPEVYDALREYQGLQEQQHVDLERFAALEDLIANNDGYALPALAGSILEGLGIPSSHHRDLVSTLSGGYKLRVLLAQLLISKKEILLLDEPTNHLDIVSIRWLERYLSNYEGCLIVISHDRSFLDGICTHILDVDYKTITSYKGNYTQFVKQKEIAWTQKQAELEHIKTEIAHKQAFVERFRSKASKARQAQSRLKQIEKIEVPVLPMSTRQKPSFRFAQKRPSGKDVVEVQSIGKAYAGKPVLQNVSFLVRRQERVAVIGPNGVGKSTLLKILANAISPDVGQITFGHETKVGYFAQGQETLVQASDKTLEEWLMTFCPVQGPGFVRALLGKVLFSKEDAQKPISVLSGGELARLDLARLMVEEPNVLLLDEPTNHLDMESIEALLEALHAYTGTLLFVSHDRFFVSHLADRILEITQKGVRDLRGTYQEYLKALGEDHLAPSQTLRHSAPMSTDKEEQKQLYLDQKKRHANIKKQKQELEKVQEQLKQLEERKRQIESIFCEVGFFTHTPMDGVRALQLEQQKLEEQITHLFQRWEELEKV